MITKYQRKAFSIQDCVTCFTLTFAIAATSCATNQTEGGAFPHATRIDFEANDGEVAIRLEPWQQSIRVSGRGGVVLAMIHSRGDHLIVADGEGRTLWRIEPPGPAHSRFRVTSPGALRPAFEVQREPDGDLEVYDESGRRISIAKHRSYGYKVVSGEGEELGSIRERPGKISIRDASGTTYLSTRGVLPVEAVAFLVIEALPIEVAVGLSVAVAFWSPPSQVF